MSFSSAEDLELAGEVSSVFGAKSGGQLSAALAPLVSSFGFTGG